MATVGIHPNDFDLNPNKIPTGGVVQNKSLQMLGAGPETLTEWKSKSVTNQLSAGLTEVGVRDACASKNSHGLSQLHSDLYQLPN